MASGDYPVTALQTVAGSRPRPAAQKATTETIPDEELEHILDEEEPRWAGLLDRLAQ